jgi:hypothetical protein
VTARVEFRGASGSSYSFFPLDEAAPLRPIGVTYAIAERHGREWRLLAVGHTNNLAAKSWVAELEALNATGRRAQMLVRLNISRAIREAEAADLAAAVTRQPEAD